MGRSHNVSDKVERYRELTNQMQTIKGEADRLSFREGRRAEADALRTQIADLESQAKELTRKMSAREKEEVGIGEHSLATRVRVARPRRYSPRHEEPMSDRSEARRWPQMVRKAATRLVTAGALVVVGGDAIKRIPDEQKSPPKANTPSPETAAQVKRMSSPKWNLPVDLGGTIVVYPAALDNPALRDRAGGAPAIVDRIAAALHVDSARARDPDATIVELVLAKIPESKQREYEEKLGTVLDQMRAIRPASSSTLFQFSLGPVIPVTRRDIESYLTKPKQTTSEETLEDFSSATEKEKAVAAMMAGIERRIPPTGYPKGYRGVSALNVKKPPLCPGHLPRVSAEEVDQAFEHDYASRFQQGERAR